MTRPQMPAGFFSLPRPERDAYLAADRAWEASPEGIAELAAEKAEREAQRWAAYQAALPAAIETLLRHGAGPGQRMELPERALDIVLAGGLQETPARAAVRDATDICVLGGGPGTTKTCAAVCWCREHIVAPANWRSTDVGQPYFVGMLPLWISAGQLARLDHFDQKAIDRVAKAQRLVIDDLGAEYADAKGFFNSLLDELIDARYSGKRPTVVTTNLDAEAFKARYGARIIDRIREGGRFVNCGDVSLRRRPVT